MPVRDFNPDRLSVDYRVGPTLSILGGSPRAKAIGAAGKAPRLGSSGSVNHVSRRQIAVRASPDRVPM
jgi:hypothetical protein